MVIEVVLLYLGLATATAFVADNLVDIYKHSKYSRAEMYEACVKHAKEVKECRLME